MFIGRLGKSPEVRVTNSGKKVATLSLAVSEKYKDQSGNQQESTEWISVVLWNKQSEVAEKYLKKGSMLYVEGKWKTQSWEKDGQKHYRTELLGSHFQMLGGGKGGSSETKADVDGYPKNSQPQNPTYGGQNETPPAYEDNMPF
jgi:single-strand DNA-binding protein